MRRSLLYLGLLVGLLFACFGPANAAEDAEIGKDIVAFLNDPYSPSNEILTSTPKQALIVDLIGELTESVYSSNPDRLAEAITIAKTANVEMDHEILQTLDFADRALEFMKLSDERVRKTSLIALFDTFQADENWYLESVALSLSAFLYTSNNQTLIATERASKAMAVIPSKLSPKVTDARILASGAAIVLHGLQGNPDFMLDAARLQREAKATIGEPIDRYELMTNFIFALNRSREHESAAMVANLLLQETRPENVVPGIAESYIATTYNEMGVYAQAEVLAREALKFKDHPFVDRRGHLELVVALAGQNKTVEAERLIRARGWAYDQTELLSTVRNQTNIHAEALLAMHRGDSELALSLMKRRADLIIDQVQSANSSEISAMLSSLENTRERQLEREGALQREAELRAVQLQQKTDLNRMLWVLIGGLTVAFNLLLAFLRYREKLNAQVQGLQEDALSAEKMKTEFLGVINHELRTPLNGIIGISDAMIHNSPDEITRAQSKTIQESGQLLFDLLDSLITMSTIEGNRLTLDNETINLPNVIHQEVEEWTSAASEKGLTFTQFIAPELKEPLIADAKNVRKCLRFLLSNAVRFTHEGRIHLHATGEQAEDGRLDVKIIVADTGQGISDDVQARLFKPFLQADAAMTRKYGGAGLSLAIGRKIARMMGGDLTVTSREGRGSEFTLTARLPLAAHYDAPEKDASDADPNDLPVPNFDQVETPEAVIDLMLKTQFAHNQDQTDKKSETKPRRFRSRFKSIG